jgi:hypothetical protein
MNVVIKCPTTGQIVPTGLAMDPDTFRNAILEGNGLGNCPACGGNHVWSKSDAFLR